jgi:deoxyribodipyrimidine photo-lyase
MSMARCIVLFQKDLRIHDNAVLRAAAEKFQQVVPLYAADFDVEDWALGGASRWWLHHSLIALEQAIAGLGGRLLIRSGGIQNVLGQVLDETGAEAIYWTACSEPKRQSMERALQADLKRRGIEAEAFPGETLFTPGAVLNQQGGPFQVFTPFWKACLRRIAEEGLDAPLAAPRSLVPAPRSVRSESIDDLKLLPTIPWDAEFKGQWHPGELGAQKRLRYLRSIVLDYHTSRNRPALDGTSALSPHLHFGEISPRQVVHAVLRDFGLRPDQMDQLPVGPRTFLTEIGWREFAHSVLHHFPKTDQEPLRPQFAEFPWKPDAKLRRAWQRGLTGYPIVDAGMRQLWRTGWMHNRVRMIVGSFLTKDLLQSWQSGAEWFWDTLVDADLANNSLNWQWVSGCGADASPYFRVFNPVLQGEKFDPQGDYVRRWVPELGKLSNRQIHAPWLASADVLAGADVELGVTYPFPIVDHEKARREALAALATIRRATESR